MTACGCQAHAGHLPELDDAVSAASDQEAVEWVHRQRVAGHPVRVLNAVQHGACVTWLSACQVLGR